MTRLQRLARRLGYDLTPRKKAKPPNAQLAAVLERFGITCVLDVGANCGQYGARLRDWGYRGRIVSFEPQALAHAALTRRAAADPTWRVAPRMTLGERDGEVEIEVSAESDMSSILPQSALLREISPSSAVLRQETAPLRRLDGVVSAHLTPADRVFLKIDTQGFDIEVLRGARDCLSMVKALQTEASVRGIYKGMPRYTDTIRYLDECGFDITGLYPVSRDSALRLVEFDCVMINRSAIGAGCQS